MRVRTADIRFVLGVLPISILQSLLLLALFLTVFPSPAFAQTPESPSDDDVNRVAKQLYCPVCENVPLDVCPTAACEQWRGVIREKLAQGWSDAQITQYFADQYGDRVLAQPPARGLSLLVYIVPPLAVLLGAVLLVRWMRTRRKPASTDAAPVQPQDEYVARLERELRERG